MIRSKGNLRSARRGYAMAAVLIFMAVTLALVAISQRQLGTVLRLKRSRSQVEVRDEGAVHALARGIQLLETGSPPGDPYVCATIVETPLGNRSYTVTFTSLDTDRWNVQAAPTPDGDSPPPMPATFAP